jgi:hypothetical protein
MLVLDLIKVIEKYYSFSNFGMDRRKVLNFERVDLLLYWPVE